MTIGLEGEAQERVKVGVVLHPNHVGGVAAGCSCEHHVEYMVGDSEMEVSCLPEPGG